MNNPQTSNTSEPKNEIIVYQPDSTIRLDVRLENETVWLNQARLGELFCVDRTVINRHIHNIYKTGELDERSTCAKIAQVQVEGSRSITRIMPFYNLDMIIAVGYRVNSMQATRFRQWATPYTYRFCFRGIERNAPVAVTTNGNRREKRGYMHGYDAMLEALAPSAIICLGRPFPEMRGNIIPVKYDIYRKEVR